MSETDSKIIAIVLILLLALLWLAPLCLLARFALPPGARLRGAAGLLLFGVAATLVTMAMNHMLAGLTGPADVLAYIAIVPPLRLANALDARLWLALAVLAAGLAAAVLAQRRLRGAPALAVALALGLGVVPAAVTLEYARSRWRIETGAVTAGLDCHERRPLAGYCPIWLIWTRSAFISPVSTPLAAKGEDLWVWSYRAGAWVPLHVREGQRIEEFRAWLDC